MDDTSRIYQCLHWLCFCGLIWQSHVGDQNDFKMMTPNQGAASNRRPAGRADRSDNLSAIVAADRAFPAAIPDLGPG
jgi:hypothetical protein